MKGIYNKRETEPQRRYLRTHSTSAEALLWLKLKGKQIDEMKFRRQYGIGDFITDFYCPKARLAIELDGGVHEAPLQPERDEVRTRIIEQNNIRVIRFKNEEIYHGIEGVVEKIRKVAAERIKLLER